MCEAGCTVWGIPDSLVPRTVSFDPKSRTFGNCLVGELLVREPFRVFRFALQGYISIDCRPLTVI
jgi:hypothetical protein